MCLSVEQEVTVEEEGRDDPGVSSQSFMLHATALLKAYAYLEFVFVERLTKFAMGGTLMRGTLGLLTVQ